MREKGAFSLLALSLLDILTNMSNPVRPVPEKSRTGRSGDGFTQNGGPGEDTNVQIKS